MIYLDNIATPQTVFVPMTLDGAADIENAVVTLISTVDLAPVSLTDVRISRAGDSGGWLSVTLTLPEGLPDGSYEYRVTADGETLSTGCVLIGVYDGSTVEYKKEISYKQYERD